MEKLEDITKMCSVKINVMKSSYVPDNLLYCRNCCDGYSTEDKPCPHGMYKSVKTSQVPIRRGINAYVLMNGEKE